THGFFVESWSAWPDPRWLDDGFELSGYRVQVSHKTQTVALVRFPEGGYVRVADCSLEAGKRHSLTMRVAANLVTVGIDGKELIRYADPLPKGKPGLAFGTGSGAKVEISEPALAALPRVHPAPVPAHRPAFSARKWLGGRWWFFDGQEPILLLPSTASPSLNCAKLRPGGKPMLSWNAHWDIHNQGAYPEGTNALGPVAPKGGGKSVSATWEAKQTKGIFKTTTTLTASFDEKRQAYRYGLAEDRLPPLRAPERDVDLRTPAAPDRAQHPPHLRGRGRRAEGPASFGAAVLGTPKELAAGRYALLARVKGDNLRGPGGRIEVTVTPPKKPPVTHVHHAGAGTFGWKTTGFGFDVPEGATIALGLGNAGTGTRLVKEVAFRQGDGPAPAPPAQAAPSPEGAIADYRMEEGKGLHVLDHAGGPCGHLELSSVGWGERSLVFEDVPGRKPSWPRAGALQRYLGHQAYKGHERLPVALSGHHGGGMELKGFTVAAWIKPATRMGKSDHGGAGDIVGLGARRIVLKLLGPEAPYKLGASLNVNDRIEAKEEIRAGELAARRRHGRPRGGSVAREAAAGWQGDRGRDDEGDEGAV
ncbi:MAG: hypothetical protein K2W96_28505, partial [Gemmataceae bacterium]|nr:hypothetical protein [Gemmataceae bacterium]